MTATLAAPTLTAVTLGSALVASTYGTASAGTSFTAAGTNLSGDITVTAQSGFEVSSTSPGTSGYGSSVSVASGTTVWVRTSATRAAGDFNSTTVAVLSGGGAASGANVTSSASNNSVAAKALTVAAPTIASKAYDGTTTAGAVTVGALSGFVGTETVTATAIAAAYSSANVGTYNSVVVTYTLANGNNGGLAANYSLAAGSASGTISAKALSVTPPTIALKTYDGTTTAGAVTVGTLSGFVSGQTVTATATAAAYSSANVGTYNNVAVTYTLANGSGGGLASNYSLAAGTATGAITAKALTGSFTANNKEYDGTTSATVASRAVTGKIGIDDVNHSGGTANFDNATVGTGKTVTLTGASLTGTAAGNYTLSSVSGTTANITKATPTINTAPTASAITLGQALSASMLTGGSATPSGGSFAFTNPSTTPGVTGPFTADITYTPADITNYNTASGTTSVQVNAAGSPTLDQATLSGNLSGTYGTASAATSFTASGSNLTGTITATAQAGYQVSATDNGTYGADVTVASGSSVWVRFAALQNAGTYNSAVSVVLTSSGATPVNITTTASGNVVSTKSLSITPPSIASKTYDGTTTAGAVTVGTLSGFVGSQTVTATGLAAAYSSANVGSYSNIVVTYTLADGTNGGLATNYSLAAGSATGQITAKSLSITAPTIGSKTYDGTATAGAVTVGTLSGFVGSETVTATGSAAAYSSANVGSYSSVVVTYTLADGTNGGLASNYSLAAGSATGQITARALSVTAPSIASKVYDGTTTAGAVTVGILSGFVSGQTVTATATAAAYSSADVGTYTGVVITYILANGTGGGLASNYSLASGIASGTITQGAASISFAALPSGKKVGDAAFGAGATTNFGTISYSSSNTAVATVNSGTGIITLVAPGVTTITAMVAGTANFTGDTKSQTLNVAAAPTPGSTVNSTITWNFSTAAPSSSSVANLTVGNVTQGNNNGTTTMLGSTSASSGYTGASGGNNAGAAARTGSLSTGTNGSAYFEFTLSPAASYNFTITAISFGARSTSTGPQAYSVRSSADNYASDLATGAISNNSGWALESNTELNINRSEATTYRIYGHSGTGSVSVNTANWRIDDLSLNVTVASPEVPAVATITLNGTFSSVSTTYGTASTASSTTATVSGGSLTADIIATAPTGFQVSADETTWGTTATFTQTAGFANGTLYLRLASNTAAGSYNNQTVALSSTGATGKTLSIPNSSVSQKALTIGAPTIATKVFDGTNSTGTITLGSLSGLVGTETLTVSATGAFADANVGSSKDATITYLLGNGTNGGLASNYSLAGSTVTGDIISNTLSGNTTVAALTIPTGTTLSLNGTTLTINGAVTGTGTITGSHTSSLVLGGAAGNLRFTQSDPLNDNFLKNLTLNNGATATLFNALNITGGLEANAEGTVTVTGSATLTTGGNLTIKSNQFGTARVAAGRTNGDYISGDVTVERHIPANTTKSWRLLAANTTKTSNRQSIKAAWQEGGVFGQTTDPNPGYGTMITGQAQDDNDAISKGFDKKTPGYSLLYYKPDVDALWGVTNTIETMIDAYSGYFVFIRGDRGNGGSFGAGAPRSTTLRSKGSLLMGNRETTIPAGQFALIGNPYPSRIDLSQIAIGSGIVNSVQVWDPTLAGSYGLGGYQTLVKSGSNFIVYTPGSDRYPLNSVQNFIESGSAFFMQSASDNNNTNNTVTITESSKASGSRLVNRPSNPLSLNPSMISRLYAINSATNTEIADGNRIDYDPSYSNSIDVLDVRKNNNFGDNLGLLSNNTDLVVERRSMPNETDTIFFSTSGLKRIGYRLDFMATDLGGTGLSAVLEDTYLNTATSVSLEGTTSYTFTVDANAGSSAARRFRIVFRPQAPLPVTVTDIRARAENNLVAVEWNASNAVNLREYQVERSADGRSFSSIGTVAARNTGAATQAYRFDDTRALSGWNYYRIKSVDNDGRIRYTSIVKVMLGKAAASIAVYPNPVEGERMNLQLTNQPAGRYTLRLLTLDGRAVLTRTIEHAGGNATQQISLPRQMANGQYRLELMGSGDAPATVLPLMIDNK